MPFLLQVSCAYGDLATQFYCAKGVLLALQLARVSKRRRRRVWMRQPPAMLEGLGGVDQSRNDLCDGLVILHPSEYLLQRGARMS